MSSLIVICVVADSLETSQVVAWSASISMYQIRDSASVLCSSNQSFIFVVSLLILSRAIIAIAVSLTLHDPEGQQVSSKLSEDSNNLSAHCWSPRARIAYDCASALFRSSHPEPRESSRQVYAKSISASAGSISGSPSSWANVNEVTNKILRSNTENITCFFMFV